MECCVCFKTTEVVFLDGCKHFNTCRACLMTLPRDMMGGGRCPMCRTYFHNSDIIDLVQFLRCGKPTPPPNYQQILHGARGLFPQRSREMLKRFGKMPDQIDDALVGFSKFIFAKLVGVDVCPSEEIDLVWMAFIGHPKEYNDFCLGVCGEIIDRQSSEKDDTRIIERVYCWCGGEELTKYVFDFHKERVMFLPSNLTISEVDMLFNENNLLKFVVDGKELGRDQTLLNITSKIYVKQSNLFCK